jgi:hypothetical protein
MSCKDKVTLGRWKVVWLAEQLLAFQESFCSVGLVSRYLKLSCDSIPRVYLTKYDEKLLRTAVSLLPTDLSTRISRAVSEPQASVSVNSSACSEQNMFVHSFHCRICTEQQHGSAQCLSAVSLHITKPALIISLVLVQTVISRPTAKAIQSCSQAKSQ